MKLKQNEFYVVFDKEEDKIIEFDDKLNLFKNYNDLAHRVYYYKKDRSSLEIIKVKIFDDDPFMDKKEVLFTGTKEVKKIFYSNRKDIKNTSFNDERFILYSNGDKNKYAYCISF